MSVTTEQLIIELNKRNLKLEHIMEYIKFEDECIEKGFTFTSLIEAREKQVPKQPVMYGEDSLLCPLCDCFVGYASEARGDDVYQGKFSHCSYCGQAIDWSD